MQKKQDEKCLPVACGSEDLPGFSSIYFAFDDQIDSNLRKMNLPNITVISLHELEDEELLAVKPTRTKVEYCWTTTPSTILYCINKYQLDHCTYLVCRFVFFFQFLRC